MFRVSFLFLTEFILLLSLPSSPLSLQVWLVNTSRTECLVLDEWRRRSSDLLVSSTPFFTHLHGDSTGHLWAALEMDLVRLSFLRSVPESYLSHEGIIMNEFIMESCFKNAMVWIHGWTSGSWLFLPEGNQKVPGESRRTPGAAWRRTRSSLRSSEVLMLWLLTVQPVTETLINTSIKDHPKKQLYRCFLGSWTHHWYLLKMHTWPRREPSHFFSHSEFKKCWPWVSLWLLMWSLKRERGRLTSAMTFAPSHSLVSSSVVDNSASRRPAQWT